MKAHYLFIPAMLLIAFAISACGDTKGQRALSGGAIGAGVGGLGSAAAGGSGTTGALIGAGVGAAAGALTDKDDINFD